MSVFEYQCPACGGAIHFESKTQQMTCPYCDASFDPEALFQYDQALKEPAPKDYEWEAYGQGSGSGDWREEELQSIRFFHCPACGGELVSDENTAATHCPYCGNPAILTSRFSGMFRPDEVIPFKLGKEAAKSALQAHLKGKWLLPKFFKEDSRIDKLLGVYVPFWLFDCHADARIQYRATRTHAWSDPHYNYLKTDYFQIIREGGLSFARIPVDGSAKMENAYMEAIEPFDYGQAVGFQTAYLSGYLADKYDVDAHSSQGRANERVKKSTEAVFANTVTGYATCVPERTDLQISQGSVRYALLPVWMLNVQYKGKTYIFAMNGQTGKLAGELPVSWGRFWACFFGIFAGTAMALSAIAAFVGL